MAFTWVHVGMPPGVVYVQDMAMFPHILGRRGSAHWPRDFELSKWDGNPWAENLRRVSKP